MFICPSDHRHGEVLTCYTAHRCRCEPCREGMRVRQRKYRAGLRDSLDWGVVVEEVEHFVSLGEESLICEILFGGMPGDSVYAGFVRIGRLDLWDKVRHVYSTEEQ